ncbi:MAG: tRNA preQ1(34) S-adenosylmethionine ribosyltransferase-isomerase QueA, partial [Chlorobiales bacterium]|nr:tRNA preQ1(34) S-adenosylmethionine ribosyltransferase-isomerase QueA [Chlorobiales bacterium]
LEKHADPQQLVMYSGKLKAGHRLLVEDEEICVDEILGNGVARISSRVPLLELVQKHGSVPIPPYLKREPETTDEVRYQTVFAREHGSVAAPTASLNFTEELKSELINKGVQIAYLTLHVGLGTFLPIRVESLSEHKMHREYYQIPKETVAAIQETNAKGGRVIGLGTTVTRALEHASEQILSGPPKIVAGEADIFIYPGGYQFQIIDGLLTNFHAPRSTVLMLTVAFAGPDNLRRAYAEALRENYRFLSYGDSMLIL